MQTRVFVWGRRGGFAMTTASVMASLTIGCSNCGQNRGHIIAIDDDRLRPLRIDRLRAEPRRLGDGLDLSPSRRDGTAGNGDRPPETDDLLEFRARALPPGTVCPDGLGREDGHHHRCGVGAEEAAAV